MSRWLVFVAAAYWLTNLRILLRIEISGTLFSDTSASRSSFPFSIRSCFISAISFFVSATSRSTLDRRCSCSTSWLMDIWRISSWDFGFCEAFICSSILLKALMYSSLNCIALLPLKSITSNVKPSRFIRYIGYVCPFCSFT